MLRSFAFWKLQYVNCLTLFYFQKIKANVNPRDMIEQSITDKLERCEGNSTADIFSQMTG